MHANFETRQLVRENKRTLVASAQTYHFPFNSEWNAHLFLWRKRRRTSWNRTEWVQEVKSNVVDRDWVIFTLLFPSSIELVREESKHRGYLFFSRWHLNGRDCTLSDVTPEPLTVTDATVQQRKLAFTVIKYATDLRPMKLKESSLKLTTLNKTTARQ